MTRGRRSRRRSGGPRRAVLIRDCHSTTLRRGAGRAEQPDDSGATAIGSPDSSLVSTAERDERLHIRELPRVPVPVIGPCATTSTVCRSPRAETAKRALCERIPLT